MKRFWRPLACLSIALLASCDAGGTTGPGANHVTVFEEPPGPAWDGTAVAVTVGDRANCLLKADGTPWCWGSTRGFGMRVDIGLRNVPNTSNVDAVIDSICVANRDPVTLFIGWPCNVYAPIRMSTKAFTSLKLGIWDAALCGIDAASKMFCWDQGPNIDAPYDSVSAGGLEYCGSTLCLYSPQPVKTAESILAIAAGSSNCVVTAAGAPKCLGTNYYNTFGNQSVNFASQTYAPVLGAPVSTAMAVPPVPKFACALATTQKVFCWGESEYGVVGNGTFSVRVPTPTQVSSAQNFKAIVATHGTACALTTAGAAYCWGDGRWGQIGWNGLGWSTTPYAVSGGKTFSQIAAGPGHICALDLAGAAWCWGDNQFGQLGVERFSCGVALICASVPVAVQGGHTFTQISAGIAMTCGVTTASHVYCWGWAAYGRLGFVPPNGEFTTTPTRIMP